MDCLEQFDIYLMFLDFYFAKMKGLDLINVLNEPPKIIITSAYQEYALQGYEFNVIDYLLKPIEFSRFLKAVNKIEQTKETTLLARPVVQPAERPFLFFNVGKKKVKVF